MPAEELNASDLLLPRLILALDSAAMRGLSIAALRALLFIAAVSSQKENPNLATISDLARCLDMSISGASRVVSALRTQECALIMSDKEEHGQRQESFFLSEHGVRFMRGIDRLWKMNIEEDTEYLSFSRFAKARYVDNIGHDKIQVLAYSLDRLVMYTKPIEPDLFKEVSCFFGVSSANMIDYGNSLKAVKIRFFRKEHAVAFMLRFCPPSVFHIRKEPTRFLEDCE